MNKIKIIPIGYNCEPAIFLRTLNLREASYPWDWAFDTKIKDIVNVIKNEKEFKVEEWDRLKNINYYLPHDKNNDIHGINENKFENSDLIEKYKRRFNRFFKTIREEKIIFLRLGDNNNEEELKSIIPCSVLYMQDGREKIIETFKNLNVKSDKYYNILHIYSYIENLNFPISKEDLKKIFIEYNEKLHSKGWIYEKLKIGETFDLLIKQDIFVDKEEIDFTLKEEIKKITGKEYPLL